MMLEILGKNYYINVDTVIEKCRPVYPPKRGRPKKEEAEEVTLELNVFKFEVFKSCIERVLYDVPEDNDNDIPLFQEKSTALSFRIAFNTLLKYEILIEELDG